MSTELLTEPEILALLEEAFPPHIGVWECIHVERGGSGFLRGIARCRVAKGQMECEDFSAGWVITQKKYYNRKLVVACQGVGTTIPAAIADFRAKVAAEAAALGALKANPTSDYNNVEAAIYAAAFADGIVAGMRCEYRNMGKEEWVAMSVASAKEAVALHRAAIK